MLRKYNIALVPTSKNQEMVDCSNFFSSISDQYQLGENSLPHVTLCQFQANENTIQHLWDKACEALTEHTVLLEFKDFSCLTFDDKIFWVSLMPNQRNLLNEMHIVVAKIVNSPSKKSYDPHLTLINTRDSDYKKMADKLIKIYSPISDDFALAMGECDEIGQFTKLIHTCESKRKYTYKI